MAQDVTLASGGRPAVADTVPPRRVPRIRGGDRGIRIASAVSLVVLWILGSLVLPSSVLPGPVAVLQQLWTNATDGSMWPHMAITLGRTAGAFVVAMLIASVLGIAMGLSQRVERFFDTWLIVGMTMPALVTIIVVFMVIGLNERGTIVAAALPVVAMLTINVWEGIKGIDTKVIAMSRSFRVAPRTVVFRVVLPQVAPTLMASARFGLGLVWKMILFIELLGRSDGVGYQVQFFYQLFNMQQVLAYALAFLAVMLIIEIGIFGLVERRLFHWRPRLATR